MKKSRSLSMSFGTKAFLRRVQWNEEKICCPTMTKCALELNVQERRRAFFSTAESLRRKSGPGEKKLSGPFQFLASLSTGFDSILAGISQGEDDCQESLPTVSSILVSRREDFYN